MIMLLYDMKFKITLFDMIELPLFVLFFLIYFLISTQKSKANFQILQLNPLLGVCNGLKLNLYTCTCYVSLWEEGFCLNSFCLFALFIHFFYSLADSRLSIWTRQMVLWLDVRFVYSFCQHLQLTKLLRICIIKLLHI